MTKNQSESCSQCESQSRSAFCELKDAPLALLDATKTCNTYKAGQILFYEDKKPSGLFCIKSGLIKLLKTNADGGQTIVRMAGPGDILGYRCLFASQPPPGTAETVKDSQVCYISGDTIQSIIEKSPRTAFHFIEYLSRTLSQAENRLHDFVQKSLRERLAGFLLMMSSTVRDRSREYQSKTKTEIPFSREEIAEYMGATPEAVIRTLSDFREEGVILLQGRHLEILLPEALLHAASIESLS